MDERFNYLCENFDDHDNRVALMKEYADKFPTALLGHNEDGEVVSTSINHDNIVVETFQKNGWIRTNVYWEDGTIEELYEAGDIKGPDYGLGSGLCDE